MMGDACEFWLITVTDEQSITNPDKDHAYLTDDGKLFVFNGDSLVRVNCDICFTQEEREKLEGIEEGANKYVLPVASSTELGGVLLGYTQNGRNYPITKDTKGNIYVNVPWEEYQLPKATDNALGGIKTGYKQNGKFYPIKTDTDGNAYVQVPWEDTNTVYEVVSKTSNGLMPMLPSDENASKRFLNGGGEWVVGTDNSINGVTQTGSTFSGETSDCGVQILEVQGKTVQQTTQGYQLFDASKLPTKTIGGATVTNNGDGSFTISGSGTLSKRYESDTPYTDIPFQLKVGKLFLLVEASTYPCCYIDFADENGAYVTTISLINGGNTAELSLSSETVSKIKKYKPLFVGYVGGQIKTGTIKPMLYQDGDGTWEPFTGGKPAPNPDYPMEIENVEISEIVSHSRNLLDLSNGINKKTGEGVTYTKRKDGSYFRKGTATGVAGNVWFLGNFGDYAPTLFTLEAGTYTVKDCLLYNKANAVGTGILTLNSPTNITGVRNTNQVIGNTYDDIIYPIIYKGSSEIPWEPFKRASVETSLTLAEGDTYENGQVTNNFVNENLGDLFNTIHVSTDPKWYNPELSYSYELTEPKVKLNISYPGKCTHFQSYNFASFYNKSVETGIMNNQSYCVVNISKSLGICTTVEEFKTWIKEQNVRVLKALATPTTEEFKVPTIPSYEPYTEISTNSVVDPTITFRPLPFTTCLVGEATEEESGYMPPLSGNSNEFLNGNGNWKDIISVIDSRISAKILTFFPVGTVIQTTNSANPSTYLGGTWEAFAPGRVLIGAGQGNDGSTSVTFTANGSGGKYYPKPRALIGAVNGDIGAIGYNAAHPVSKASYIYAVSTKPVEISSINHSTEIKNEDGSEPTTVQPYMVVYMWRRTA
jgi:hypothetical protein